MILIRFKLYLEDYNIADDLIRPHGPLFHRFLPNGRADAINIPVSDKRNKLEVWFEQRGYTKDGFISYDDQRIEVDIALIPRQCKIDGGSLVGEAYFANTTESEMKSVEADRQGDEYKQLSRRIIDFLLPPLSRFIEMLRTQFGQYWLKGIDRWDSRVQSLGSYCAMLGLTWSSDGKTFRLLSPTPLQMTVTAPSLPGRGFAEYLTRDDWARIKTSFDPQIPTSLALVILGSANRLLDTGHLRQALVEGVSACELALGEFLRKNKSLVEMLPEAFNQFSKLALPSQLTLAAAMTGLVEKDILSQALKAIDRRNEIVHEGRMPSVEDETLLRKLFQVSIVLLRLPECKLPGLAAFNQLQPP